VTLNTDTSAGKEKAKEKHEGLLAEKEPLDLFVYTDGSQLKDSRGKAKGAGAGWTVQLLGLTVTKGKLSLGESAEVFDAEAIALKEGMKAAIDSHAGSWATRIHVCLDNVSVADLATGRPTTSSQKVFRSSKKWLQRG